MNDKTDQQIYKDDLDTLVRGTQSSDSLRLARARQNALRQTDRRPSSMPWLVAGACCCLLAFVFINPAKDSALQSTMTNERDFPTVISEAPEMFNNVDFHYWLDVYDTDVIASSD
jgi:hypothetical protein